MKPVKPKALAFLLAILLTNFISTVQAADTASIKGEKVTLENFVHAESVHYFTQQQNKAPVNTFSKNREPVTVENQMIIRSNIDLLYSTAVVDVTKEATFSLAPSKEFQILELIDENHYVVGTVYPGQTVTLKNKDLSGGTHVYVLGRFAVTGGVKRANELQDLAVIDAKTSNPYKGKKYDKKSLDAVRAQLEAQADNIDFTKAFGTPKQVDDFQHKLGAATGWGGLPPEDAQYYLNIGPVSDGSCVAWSFDRPPLDFEHGGYFSVIQYSLAGWLNVKKAGYSDSELVPNADGTYTVHFGSNKNCAGKVNHIEVNEGYTYGIRLYKPLDAEVLAKFIADLRARDRK